MPAPQALVVNVFTEPRRRRRGLARLLIEQIIAWSRQHGIESLVLHASDDGRILYKQLGFVQTNEMRLEPDKLSCLLVRKNNRLLINAERHCRSCDDLISWMPPTIILRPLRFVRRLRCHCDFLGNIVLRFARAHQPFVEPPDNVLEAFDAMPRLA